MERCVCGCSWFGTPKNFVYAWGEITAFDELTNGATGLEARIYLNHRLGPELIAGVSSRDLSVQISSMDVRERARKSLVLAYDVTIEVKDGHASPACSVIPLYRV